MDIRDLKHRIFGDPKDINDPNIFHKLALIPALAWIGLGADGLSSSSYGPEESFKIVVAHPYIALALAVATALTVFIISYSYAKMIEYFPTGGGGYVIATHTLGEKAGVLSGAALIVDFVLTITVSIAACGDAFFSFLPMEFHQYKMAFEIFMIVTLIILNIRGVKESVSVLAPIFIIFIITHIVLIGYGIFSHTSEVAVVAQNIRTDFNNGLSTLGWLGMLALFLRAYSMGGGTYTGIEAVSNGLQIMKDPKVPNGKRTMLYMALSLAITAGGLFICYLLLNIQPTHGQTMNALLAKKLFGGWSFGAELALITILSEAALLMVGAQAGFIGGPKVIANMAVDSWFPRRFAALSERFTMKNGVLLMGGAALALLIYTKGNISTLVLMYSINVFVTFSLSQLGMTKFFIQNRKTDKKWKTYLPIFAVALLLCVTILVITSYEKFAEGGWITFVITAFVILICYLIRKHYNKVKRAIKKLDASIGTIAISSSTHNDEPVNPDGRTAIQLVSGFNSLGVYTLLSIMENFQGLYDNIVFVSVSVVDTDSFKDTDYLHQHEESTKLALEKYVDYARRLGVASSYKYDMGTDVVEVATRICMETAREFPKSTIFCGKLTFQHEKFYHKLLHNDMSTTIQKNLQEYGVTTVIMPVHVKI